MKRAKVSVIVPIYNMEKYLRACLDSIAKQTIFNELEVVCINDGSSDSSLDILNDYASQHKNIVIIDQANAGVGTARNNGMKKATGEFIAFMDPDDYYLENNTLELLYDKAAEHSVLICGGSLSEDHNDGKWIRKTFEGIYRKYTFTEEKLISYEDYQFDFGFYRFIYNREFLLENGIFFPPYIRFQDPPFFVSAMIKAGEFYAIPNYTYCYRYGHQNLVWDERRVCAFMNGHIDDLRMSAEAGLGELHELTLHRLVDIGRGNIASGLALGSEAVLDLLHTAESYVNKDILPDGSPVTSVNQIFYEWCRELKQAQADNSALKEEVESGKESARLLLEKHNAELKSAQTEYEETTQALRNEINSLHRDSDRLSARVKELEECTTYKTGKVVLYLPKKIKRLFKKQGEN